MKDLTKYFTIKIKGITFVPTIEDRGYYYKLHYNNENLNLVTSYPLIKDEYTKEGWKIIKQGIKEGLLREKNRCEIALKRKELFGVC